MGFWNDFSRLANFRIALRLQDFFISSARKAKERNEELKYRRSLADNADEIVDAIFNNEFEKNRNKPK